MDEALQLGLALDLRELARAGRDARAYLERAGVSAPARYIADLAIEEVLSNIVRHSGGSPSTPAIELAVRVRSGSVELHFVDHGRAFDPVAAPEPPDVPLEQRAIGGVGIPLLHRLASGMRYERKGDANHLHVVIRDPAAG